MFARDSAIWRITRENVLLLGGPAAAILQIAHPEVAHGVANHSDFRRGALGRLRRTLTAVYTIVFSSRHRVEAMAARIRAIHAQVKGKSPAAYDAFSPAAQMWVLATLIMLSVETYERFVAGLPPGEREEFYREMRLFGRYFGLDPDFGPQNWPAFEAYYEGMITGGELAGLPISRELASQIARPRRPRGLPVLWPVSEFLAVEFLPSPVRERLGFFPTAGTRLLAAILDEVLPRALPAMPPLVRFVRPYREALGRW